MKDEKGFEAGHFCIVLPAYMEEAKIAEVVRDSLRHCSDVVVVDDGSCDATAVRAQEAGAVVLKHDKNKGKGAALVTAFNYARSKNYEYVITMDADGQHDPADCRNFISEYKKGKYDVIVGNRMGDKGQMPFVRRMTNSFMSWLLSREMGSYVPDTQCGYRLYSKRALPLLESDSERFAAESEALLHLSDKKILIGQAPIRVIYGSEKSKIRPIRDTFRFFSMLSRYRRLKNSPHTAGRKIPFMVIAMRGVVGGVLMGLANLVPGISGGTMLLASGIYPRFINAIAEVTRFRFYSSSIMVLGSVVVAAGLFILLLAGLVKDLVIDHRWIMYSLFIGLTLGGAPIIWRMIITRSKNMWLGMAGGFAGMVALAVVQQAGEGFHGEAGGQIFMLFLAGVAGASAMILPGVSGGYLLLVLGQYVPILTAIDAFKEALKGGDTGSAFAIGLSVMLPVGLGVMAGIAGVSNILNILLKRCRHATLGVLLGLLLGAVVGLWPFQESVEPLPGDVIKGQVMTEELVALVDPEDYPTEFFRPLPGQVMASIGLILAGFTLTYALSFMGRNKTEEC